MLKYILSLPVLAVWVLFGSTAMAAEQPSAEISSLGISTETVAERAVQLSGKNDINEAGSILAPVTSNPALPEAQTKLVATSGDESLQVLQNLNDRYKCSNESLNTGSTREEMGAILESCITAMETKLAAEPNSIPSSDLEQIKQLALAFRSEVSALNERLDKVEKVALAQNEASQFSTTTKLVGEVIVAFSDVFGSGRAVPAGAAPGGPLNANAIVSNRVRLNFRTTFTGKDLLITRLQARNSNSFSAGGIANTPQVRLGFEGSEENAEFIHMLQYQMPFGPDIAKGVPTTKVTASVVGNELDTYLKKNFNPVLAPAGTGAISRYGRFNPIYRLSAEGAGITVDHSFNPQLGLAVGYAVPRGTQPNTAPALPRDIVADPSNNNGLFNGSNLLFSQLTYSPSPSLDLGFIYARSYHTNGAGISGQNGTTLANAPFGANTRASANHYSVLASSKINSTTTLSGWAGLTNATREDAAGSADIWNYAATLAFDNVGTSGSTLGFVVGLPPRVTTSAANKDTSYHLETFYKYKLNSNLYITPGVVMILNPEGNAANPTLFLGTIRTTFNF